MYASTTPSQPRFHGRDRASLQEFRSLVFNDDGIDTLFSKLSSSGSAQSSRCLIKPGMSEMRANWTMHSLSHREPKNSI